MAARELLYSILVRAQGSAEAARELAAVGAAGHRSGERVEAGAREATAGLRQLDVQADRTQASMRGIGTAAAALGVGLGLGELVQAGRAAVATAAEMEGLERRIAGFEGGSSQAAETIARLRREAWDLGASFGGLAEGYTALLPLQEAGILAAEHQQAIYRGLIDVQARAGASSAQLGQVMFGLAQGLSAGTLRAEELNQVTEPIPGLLNALDRAAGVAAGGFRRMVNDGQVTSEFFRDTLIAALREYEGAAEAAATGVQAAMARAGDAIAALQDSLVNRGAVAEALNSVAGVAQVWAGNAEMLGEQRQAAEANAEAVERLAVVIGTVLIARGLGPMTGRLAAATAAQARHTAAVAAGTDAATARAQALQAEATALAAEAAAEQRAAAAMMQHRQAELAFARQQQANAAAELRRLAGTDQQVAAMARLDAANARVVQSETAVAAATGRHAAATAAATTATNAQTAAQLRLSVAGRAMAAATGVASSAMTGLRGAMAFLGGPAGVAITALAGGMYLFSGRATAAERAQQAAGRAMEIGSEQAQRLAAGLDAAARSYRQMDDAAQAVTVSGIERSLQQQLEALDAFRATVAQQLRDRDVLVGVTHEGPTVDLRLDLPETELQRVRDSIARYFDADVDLPTGELVAELRAIAEAADAEPLREMARAIAATAEQDAAARESIARLRAELVLYGEGADALSAVQRQLLEETGLLTAATDELAEAQRGQAAAMDAADYDRIISRLRETRETIAATGAETLAWQLAEEGASRAQSERAVGLQRIIDAQEDLQTALKDGESDEIARAEAAVRGLTAEWALTERARAHREALNQAVADGVPMYAALQVAAEQAAAAETAILGQMETILGRLRERTERSGGGGVDRVAKARERDIETLRDLETAIGRVALAERARAGLASADRLSEHASDAQRERAAALARELHDLEAGVRLRREARTEAEAYAATIAELRRLEAAGAIDGGTRARLVERERLALLPELVDEVGRYEAAVQRLDQAEAAGAVSAAERQQLLDRLRAETFPGLISASQEYEQTLQRLARWQAAGAIDPGQAGRLAEEAYERMLGASDQWRDGAELAMRQYARSAQDAGSAAQKSLTEGLRTVEDMLVQVATTGKVEWSDMVTSMLADIARLMIRQQITGPLAEYGSSFLSSFFGSAGGGGGGGLGGVTQSAGTVAASVLHRGGPVDGSAPTRAVAAAAFAGAPRYHSGSPRIANDEEPAILQRGEVVLSRVQVAALQAMLAGSAGSAGRVPALPAANEGRMPPPQPSIYNVSVDAPTRRTFGPSTSPVNGGGGYAPRPRPEGLAGGGGGEAGPITINVYDQSGRGSAVRAEQRRGPGGSREIDLYIEERVAEGLGSGRMDRVMSGRYGASPKPVRRRSGGS